MSADNRCSVNEVYEYDAKDFGRFKEAAKVFFTEENKKHYQYMTFAFHGETKADLFVTFNSIEQFLGSAEVAFPFKKEVSGYSKIAATDICGSPADTEKWLKSPEGEAMKKGKVRWFVLKEAGFVRGDLPLSGSTVRMTPYLKVNDKAKVEEWILKMVEATQKEKDCLHYGFAYCEKDNLIYLRFACTSAAAALEHLDNVREHIQHAAKENIWEISDYNICGPRDEIEKLKTAAEALSFNAVYFHSHA